MEVYMDSHVGIVRENNEDCSKVIDLSGQAYALVVADGMGGHNKGEVASRIAVDSVEEYFRQNESEMLEHLHQSQNHAKGENEVFSCLKNAIEYANQKIYALSSTREYKMMGTTVVLALIFRNKAYIANVGDSRCYQLKEVDGNTKLLLITKDNSLVQELVDLGEITIEEAEIHPQRNVITRAVGIDVALKVDLYKIDIQKKNLLLLCSDGLSGMLSDTEIENILKGKASVKEKVKELINKALKNGGRDNVTVICAEINEVE